MRLIDADALMRCIPVEEIASRMAVANAPTIEERKKGKWIHAGTWTDPYTADEEPVCQCSVCGKEVIGYGTSNFCSECGADMRGEK